MITQQEIERIKNLPDNEMVLMAVVNVNPAIVDNEGDGLGTRAKSMMKDADVPVSLMKRVLNDIDHARREWGKSSVFVVGEDVYERFDVQLDLPERFHYGRPITSIVREAAELYPPVGVLVIDQEWGRFFKWEQGELMELRKDENEREVQSSWRELTVQRAPAASRGGVGPGHGTPNQAPNMAGAADTDYFQWREDANMKRFFNDVSDELQRLMKEHGLSRLILVGPEDRASKFAKEIPDTAPFEIIGITNAEVGSDEVEPQMLFDRIQMILEDRQNQEIQQTFERIQEQGAVEVERVLEWMQQNRIYELVIPENGSQMHIWRSHNRDVPYFTSKEMEKSPVDGSLMERVTLEECLDDFRDLYGVKVRRMYGDHGRRLVSQYGGMAGFTRY